MSRDSGLKMPNLIYLADYNNDFSAFFEAAYEIFTNAFILRPTYFNGVRVGLKKHPMVDDKECTFYHVTHCGDIEKERTPDIRRIERIRYPSFIIHNNNHSSIKVWQNRRGKDERILLFHEDENYLVVLCKRKGFLLFWTAYLIETNHTKRKLLKEYETYIKANAAQQD